MTYFPKFNIELCVISDSVREFFPLEISLGQFMLAFP